MSAEAKEAIFRVLMQVPSGKVVTYGQVAKLAGLGRAARFVGTVLKNLPKDSQIPWHRVINGQGKIAFPEQHPGRRRQESLLIKENITIYKGKINLKEYQWNP